MQRVLGYYTDWAKRLPPERVDFRLFTHLCHAFVNPKPDGTLTPPTRAKSLCERAKEKRVSVLLSIGGAESNQALSACIANKSAFDRFLSSVADLVDKSGYAGVDVDWEAHNGNADRDNMNILVSRLREQLGKGKIITMATPAGKWGGQWFDTATLLPLVDWFNVMNYDYSGPWGERAGHNANLFPYPGDGGMSDVVSMDYWTKNKGCPKDKLLLGIPCYGRGFAVGKIGDVFNKAQKAAHADVSWYEVDGLLRMGWKRQWDSVAHVPSLVSPRGDEWVSYEDFDSAREKGEWAKKQGLGGIFFWEISQDFVDGTNVIVQGARRGFIK